MSTNAIAANALSSGSNGTAAVEASAEKREIETAAASDSSTQSPLKSAYSSSAKLFTAQDIAYIRHNKREEVVADMLPRGTVAVLVGDSGLGKTPLLLQLARAVEAGVPFLDQPTVTGSVLYVDFENGLTALWDIIEQVSAALNVPYPPQNLETLYMPSMAELEKAVRDKPYALVIIDALRGLDPEAEGKNERMGKVLKQLQKLGDATGTAFVLLHHTKKPDANNPPPSLINAPIMEWLQQASGARALINQTYTRLGIEEATGGEIELVMKGHTKLAGPFGPWMIGRIRDGGDPIGYKRISGLSLLYGDMRTKFPLLPDEFRFSAAEKIWGKGPKTTSAWLNACINAGLLKKSGKHKETRYHKTALGLKESANAAPRAA